MFSSNVFFFFFTRIMLVLLMIALFHVNVIVFRYIYRCFGFHYFCSCYCYILSFYKEKCPFLCLSVLEIVIFMVLRVWLRSFGVWVWMWTLNTFYTYIRWNITYIVVSIDQSYVYNGIILENTSFEYKNNEHWNILRFV